jgi:mannose-6-phosphate isomerase-like protein (cupin superfamily)
MTTTPYTLAHLTDVEDLAVRYGRSPQYEARFARDTLGCEQLGITFLRYAPGEQSPWAHRHGQAEEIYAVLQGGGTVTLDGEDVELRERDLLRVAPQTARRFAAGPDGLALFAIGPYGLDDVERIEAAD